MCVLDHIEDRLSVATNSSKESLGNMNAERGRRAICSFPVTVSKRLIKGDHCQERHISPAHST
jgi:hypothetical protein